MRVNLIVALLMVVGMEASTSSETMAGHSSEYELKSFYAGLGIAAKRCVSCHNIGSLGPTMMSGSNRAPSFENISKNFGNDPDAIFRRILDINSDDSSLSRMPPIHLGLQETQWVSEYISKMGSD